MCAAPLGNKFWEARSKHGRDLIFSTPEILWDACVEYFEWVDCHYLIECKATQHQGKQVDLRVYKMQAMTQAGLCLFLKISQMTWSLYRQREDFVEVINRVEDALYHQKFSGAAADLLNANIISRDLGLIDKSLVAKRSPLSLADLTEMNLDSDMQRMVTQANEMANMSDDELKAKLKRLQDTAAN